MKTLQIYRGITFLGSDKKCTYYSGVIVLHSTSANVQEWGLGLVTFMVAFIAHTKFEVHSLVYSKDAER